MVSAVLERMKNMLSAQRREKGSKIKSLVPCPEVAKLCNSGMAGVDIMDQCAAACRWNKSHLSGFTCAFSLI